MRARGQATFLKRGATEGSDRRSSAKARFSAGKQGLVPCVASKAMRRALETTLKQDDFAGMTARKIRPLRCQRRESRTFEMTADASCRSGIHIFRNGISALVPMPAFKLTLVALSSISQCRLSRCQPRSRDTDERPSFRAPIRYCANMHDGLDRHQMRYRLSRA